MFKDESGRLANVPSVDALRKAMKETNYVYAAASEGHLQMKSLMEQIAAAAREIWRKLT